MAEQQKRQIAYKTRIKDLVSGRYVKEEGWTPNYIECGDKKISRANLIGTIVSKESMDNYQSIALDDGTGKISARTFEKNMALDKVDVGDVVLLIGRPREYGGEKYILIEIIRKIENKKWILYRKAEFDGAVEEKAPEKAEEAQSSVQEEAVESVACEESSAEKIIKRIRALDSGNGADFEEVIKGMPDGEKTAGMLLKEGDIFEIKPGRLKVLD